MHVALTDVLTCPACGPGHGLILVPDEVRERRVIGGFLGCADCRTRYRVREGVAEFRTPPGAVRESGGSAAASGDAAAAGARPSAEADLGGSEEGATRLAALLGLTGGQGVVLLAGPAAAEAARLAAGVEGVEVVATVGTAAPGVSPARLEGVLPFQSMKLRAVALTGEAADALLEEGARVLAPAGRLLVDPAAPDARARLQAAGLRVLAEQAGTLVVTR